MGSPNFDGEFSCADSNCADPRLYRPRMPQALDRFFDTPELHFLAFDQDDALFARMDRASYHRSIFLDHRTSSLDPEPIRTAIEPLIAVARERTIPRTGWIFHIAHCGSTLLARMIDRPQSGLVLREPPPLRQLGVQAVEGSRSDAWADRLKLAYAMAARRFEASQPTVVKANVPVNFIIPQIVELDPGAPVILLYLPFELYLLAILREPRRRAWVDRVARLLEPALGAMIDRNPPSNTVERAAALWRAQMLIFDAVLDSNPSARSLDAEQFFASPAKAAEAAAMHFGLSHADEFGRLDELTSTYSKDPSQPFDEAARRQRQKDARIMLRDELGRARRWIEQAAPSGDLPQTLGQPLLGEASLLVG